MYWKTGKIEQEAGNFHIKLIVLSIQNKHYIFHTNMNLQVMYFRKVPF